MDENKNKHTSILVLSIIIMLSLIIIPFSTGWLLGIIPDAEDMGVLTEDVRELLKESGLPGMKVLEFAFSPGADSDYLPHNIVPNSVCYTGTHDNAPLAQWFEDEPEEAAFAKAYLGLNEEEGMVRGMLRAGMSSTADTFIAQMQDWLELGRWHRMNTPGEAVGNWQWRMLPGEASEELAERIRQMTEMYGRLAEKPVRPEETPEPEEPEDAETPDGEETPDSALSAEPGS